MNCARELNAILAGFSSATPMSTNNPFAHIAIFPEVVNAPIAP